MATIEKLINTPHGALQYNLLKCDQCDALSTPLAALGWVRLENLSQPVETLGGVYDYSGDFCSPECLMAKMIEDGVSVQAQQEGGS